MLFTSEVIAEGFFTGRSPLIPGTIGTIPGVILWYFIPSGWAFGVTFVILFLGSIPGVKEKMRKEGEKDPPCVVIDEVLGFFVAGAFHSRDLRTAISLFLLFRVLDVLKPWPASYFDKKQGALYVLMDDLVAGAYASAIFFLVVSPLIFH
jgi:phosphatidylglycerophosphatase A